MNREIIKRQFIILLLGLVFAEMTNAQNQISLVETTKVKEYLTLDENQYKIITSKVEQIKVILDEGKKIISSLRERFKNGDEPGFFEKIKVKRGHDSRVDKIEDLLEEIEVQLNDERKIKFNKMKKPELKALDKKELTE